MRDRSSILQKFGDAEQILAFRGIYSRLVVAPTVPISYHFRGLASLCRVAKKSDVHWPRSLGRPQVFYSSNTHSPQPIALVRPPMLHDCKAWSRPSSQFRSFNSSPNSSNALQRKKKSVSLLRKCRLRNKRSCFGQQGSKGVLVVAAKKGRVCGPPPRTPAGREGSRGLRRAKSYCVEGSNPRVTMCPFPQRVWHCRGFAMSIKESKGKKPAPSNADGICKS
jgi:hypothetical protein